MAGQHLADFCDVYRTRSDGRDKAGAVREGEERPYQSLPCGVVPTADPVEVVVAGRVMGIADATVYLPGDSVIRETDEIHVRKTRTAAYDEGNPAYLSEHRIFSVIGTDEISTHGHFLAVYVSRKR
jgi:hypothetical protein